MKYYIVCVLSLIFFIIGCAKVPDQFETSRLKIVAENDNKYKLIVETVLTNENHSVALLNINGQLELVNNKQDVLEKMNFKVEEILPYTSKDIRIEKTISKEALNKIINDLDIDKNKSNNKIIAEDVTLTEKNIILKNIEVEKTNIIDLLKGNLDEKN